METQKIGDKEYEVVEHYEEAGLCYEWHDAAVLRDGDSGQLYFIASAGCSCNWLWDDVRSVNDLTPIATLHEAVELFKADDFSESDVVEFAKRLLF